MQSPLLGLLTYRTNLIVMRDQTKSALLSAGAALSDEAVAAFAVLDGLLQPEPAHALDWLNLNEAELRLFGMMPVSTLKGEMPALFERAVAIGTSGADVLKTAFDAATTDDDRRAIASALLRRMYVRYNDRRVDRYERSAADRRMVWYALAILGLFLMVVAALIFQGTRGALDCTGSLLRAAELDALRPASLLPYELRAMQGLSCVAAWHWLVVAYFGVVGALFSRLIAYRGERDALGREALRTRYDSKVILVRLLVGAFGAILFYFVMAGDLLAGQMFLEKDVGFWIPSGDGMTTPSANFFRLMVWSAIAGFSERLVSDRFADLGNTAKVKPA